MKVNLTYFKVSGKFYSEGTYNTNWEGLWEVWQEVEEMLHSGGLPDLVDGAREFHILVDVPDHPHRHPRLILTPYPDRREVVQLVDRSLSWS